MKSGLWPLVNAQRRCARGRCIKFRVVLRVGLENPKSKSQIPNKFQGLKFQNSGDWLPRWSLEFGVLFGIWDLEFRARNGKPLMRQPRRCATGFAAGFPSFDSPEK
jgi:hypothetical protein